MKGWKKRALSMLLAFLMIIGVCVPHSSIVHAEDPVPPAEGGHRASRAPMKTESNTFMRIRILTSR